MSEYNPHETLDPFVAFLYELTRDRVPPGTINGIIRDQTCESLTEGWKLTDKEIAALAERWVKELRDQTPVIKTPGPSSTYRFITLIDVDASTLEEAYKKCYRELSKLPKDMAWESSEEAYYPDGNQVPEEDLSAARMGHLDNLKEYTQNGVTIMVEKETR